MTKKTTKPSAPKSATAKKPAPLATTKKAAASKTAKTAKTVKPVKAAAKKNTPAKKTPVKKNAPKKATPKKAAKKAVKKPIVKAPARSQRIRLNVSPATRAILDMLCDGRWHTRDEVLDAGAAATLSDDYKKAVAEGKRVRRGRKATIAEYAESGSRHFARNNLMILQRRGRVNVDNTGQKFRMSAATARAWRRDRSAQAASAPGARTARQHFGDETVYGGMLEFDGWAYSPLIPQDIAYVRPNTVIPVDKLRAAFPAWKVKENPDGLIQIEAPLGAPVKDGVTEWMAAQGYHHEGVRDSRNVRRRDITLLPQVFLNDLVQKNIEYAKRRVDARHAASMQRLIGDRDDIYSQVGLWVMELVEDFDAEKGVPFAAWLTAQIPTKVQDLNRASHGRTAADAEMRRAREIAAFNAQHGRNPTDEELRKRLGLSKKEMARKERDLANLRGLRSTSTLDTGPDAPELPIVDPAQNPERDYLQHEQRMAVSRALLGASAQWNPDTGQPEYIRYLGFLITYLMTWQEWTKGDLTILSERPARVVNDQVDAVQRELAERLVQLRDL